MDPRKGALNTAAWVEHESPGTWEHGVRLPLGAHGGWKGGQRPPITKYVAIGTPKHVEKPPSFISSGRVCLRLQVASVLGK